MLTIASMGLMVGLSSCSDEKEKTGTELSSAKADIAVQSVTLNKKIVPLKVGDTCHLMANVLPKEATNKNVSWVSRNPSVAAFSICANVSETVITGVGEGETWIVCTSTDNADAKDSCKVEVNPAVEANENDGNIIPPSLVNGSESGCSGYIYHQMCDNVGDNPTSPTNNENGDVLSFYTPNLDYRSACWK